MTLSFHNLSQLSCLFSWFLSPKLSRENFSIWNLAFLFQFSQVMAIDFKLCFPVFLLLSLLFFPLCSPQGSPSPAGPAPSPQDHNGPRLPPKRLAPAPSTTSNPPPPQFSPSRLPEQAAPPPPVESKKKSGLNGGQKAGIVVGVMAGAVLIGLGGMVYKKRSSNIRRANFGQAARRSFHRE